jgi:nitroreductase
MRINQTQLDAATVMTAPEAALSRRSIRNYAPTPIPDADLLQLLRLAGRAPSAFNVQPWRFVVVQDNDLKAKLAEVAHGQQQIVRAPATIVMYSDMESALARIPEAMHPDMPAEKRDAGVQGFRGTFAKQTVDEREAWGNAQTNIALGYLLLLAESLGYATSPMLGFDPEKVKAQLGLPAHVRITALVSVGYPAEEGFRPHRLSVDTLVEFR